MSKTNEWMGPSSYARHREIDLSTLKTWIREGKLEGSIKKGSNNRNLIHKELADNLMDGPPENTGESSTQQSSPKMSLTKARTAKVALEAKTAQIKYEALSGTLVDKNQVQKEAKELGLTLKESLLNIPDRLAPILASETNIDDINFILTEAIDEALRNIALDEWSPNE